MRISDNMNYEYMRHLRYQDGDGAVVTKAEKINSKHINTQKVDTQRVDIQNSDLQNTQYKDNGSLSGLLDERQSKQKILPTSDVVDYAVKRDMNKDKSLIGSESNIENLDVRKAISDMQKDSVLREYQVFVQNPDTMDGTVRKILRDES